MEESQPSSTLTRTAVTPVETPEAPAPEKVKETESDKVEPTPTELVNLGRPPYITDLLEARMAYETFDVKEQLHEIDAFIREGIEDSRASYEQVFNSIKAQVGEQDSVYTICKKMVDYVRLQNKINGIIKEKEAFEAKSPEEMSSSELKRYINGRR